MSAADALAQLQSFQQPDSATVLSQAQQKYGIQGLQDRVNTYKTLTQNLTGSIAAVDPSVTGRTSGSLVTEGQRGALVNRERAPLVGQLGTADTALQGATGDLNVADTNARGEANATIADNQTKYNRLKDAYETANQQEQQQAAAQRQAEQDAEARREFDTQQATTRGSSSYGGGGGSASAADVKGAIQQGLSSVRGKDGYVSPQDYAQGLKAWLEAGLPRDQYNKQYSSFRNPGNKYYDYAIKQAGL